MGYEIYQGDALLWLDSLAEQSVDLVVTDPPYESLEKHRKVGTTTRLSQSTSSSNPWFSTFANEKFPLMFQQFHRVLKPSSHLYLFSDQETLYHLREAAGPYFTLRKFLIWDKVNIGMGYSYRARHELILFFEKTKCKRKRLRDLSIPDVLSFKRLKGKKVYPAEKPKGLLKVLIEQSTEDEELVVDPFMGSASTGVAALELNRRFAGIDISEKAVSLAKEKLESFFEMPHRPS